MATSTRSARMAACLALLGALVPVGGSAFAQVCVASGAASTRCSLLLSRPRTYTVQARLQVLRGDARDLHMTLAVNGRPCGALQDRDVRFVHASCRAPLPAGTSYIEAGVAAADGHYRPVGVQVVPDNSLAELPREADELYPKLSRLGFWAPWHFVFP